MDEEQSTEEMQKAVYLIVTVYPETEEILDVEELE